MGDRDGLRLSVWGAVGATLLAAGFLLAGLPLLEAPGWELAMAGALAAAVAGAPAGIAAARRELRRPEPSALRAFGRASAAVAAVEVALLLGALARSVLASPCSSTAGLAFLPVLAFPGVLISAALGTLCGFAARGRRLAAALFYLAAVTASLAASLWEAWRGPAAYVLVQLLGTWPGPIYDEALAVDRRLVLFRLGTLAWTGAIVAAASLLARRRTVPPPPIRGPALGLALSLAAVASLRVVADRSGDIASRAAVDRALGGRRTGQLCDVHHPREKPPAEVERVLRDCEVDAAEVATALGIERPPMVSVWLHRSEEEKRRLVGAGRTDFTKPWVPEIQLLDAPQGPASLRHELVHALAGSLARGPLRVPARAGIWVNAGLVEGLAVALDLPHGEWTAHEWARAMRDLGLLPPASRLVEPAGFFAAPPARAYAASGSLLRFLLDRYGPAPLRRAYAGATMEEAFGRPLAGLEAEWLAFLEGVAAPPELAAAAEARFRPPGLFASRCAREVAGLEWSAAEAQRQGRPLDAAARWRRAAVLSADPGDLRAAGEALKLADPAGADRVFVEALSAAGSTRPALRAALLESRGDLRWRAGDASAATAYYREALALRPDRAQARLLEAKQAAASDPALGAAAGPWLLGVGDPGLALSRLSSSERPLAAYLLGRAAVAGGAPRLGARLLSRALEGPLPTPAFRTEALRVAGQARCAAGDDAGAAAAFAELERTAGREADREIARAGARRCAAERRAFGAPPPPASDWPR